MSTILLVDNDPLEALACKSTLEKRFHDVQRVADPAEALCLIEQPQFTRHLGLVVLGLNQPGIGGPDFVAELHARIPSVPVLVLGNENEPAVRYESEGVHLLPKPFASGQMLDAAGRILDRSERKSH